MATWRELSKDNCTAANELFVAQRWRSCASRAYYSVYAEVTHGLLGSGVTMPAGRNNPNHHGLDLLIGNNLTLLPIAKRWRLSDLVHRLYNFRIIADYVPAVTLEKDDSRICLGLMTDAFVCLRGLP
jgi:uncharacterized protein (UPF0332 family)